MGQNSLVLFQVWSSSLSDVFVQNQMFVLKKDNKQKLKIKKIKKGLNDMVQEVC